MAITHVASFGNTQATATVTTIAATSGSAIAIGDYITAFVQNTKTGAPIVTVDDNGTRTHADPEDLERA